MTKVDLEVVKEEFVLHPSMFMYLFKLVVLLSSIADEKQAHDAVNTHFFFENNQVLSL